MQKYTATVLVAFLVATFIFLAPALLGAPPDRVTLCHTPSDPDTTMEVPEHSVDAHLSHDDYLGACNDSSSSSSSSGSSDSSASSSSSSSSSESSSSSSSSSSSEESSSSSSSPSSSSSESSASSSAGGNDESDHGNTPPAVETPINARGQGRGGGGGSVSPLESIFSGHGLSEHASAVNFVLSAYELQAKSVYSFGNLGNNPHAYLTEPMERYKRKHAAICSMFRYFQNLQTVRPFTPDDYIDWIAEKLGKTLGEGTASMKDAILGRPHVHTGTDRLFEGINDQGCAANAYVYEPPTETTTMDTVSEEQPHTTAQNKTPAQHHTSDEFQVKDRSTDSELIFSIMRGGDVFKEFGSNLTHEMHMIIVRDDLQHFYHIHPERNRPGEWHIPFAPTVGGTYWIYTNFRDREGQSYGLRFIRTYTGGEGEKGEMLDFSQEKILGSYHFRFEPNDTGSGMTFTYAITDDAGNYVHPQEFMGAFGHQIIVSTNGYFSHSHPTVRLHEHPVFYVDTPPTGLYMIFVSFDIKGEEYTLGFRWIR